MRFVAGIFRRTGDGDLFRDTARESDPAESRWSGNLPKEKERVERKVDGVKRAELQTNKASSDRVSSKYAGICSNFYAAL